MFMHLVLRTSKPPNSRGLHTVAQSTI
jgi:hypothetical protein